MKKTFNYFAISSCFILGATIAHADSRSYQGYSEGTMSESMDTNSDGKITREEFDALRAKRFQELDANNDGRITVEEMKGGHEKMFGSGRNRMSDEERNSRGSSRSPGDMNTRNQSSRGGWSDNSQEQSDNSRRGSSSSQDRSGGFGGSGMSGQSGGSRSNSSSRSGDSRSGSSSSTSSEGSGTGGSGSSGGSSGTGQ